MMRYHHDVQIIQHRLNLTPLRKKNKHCLRKSSLQIREQTSGEEIADRPEPPVIMPTRLRILEEPTSEVSTDDPLTPTELL